MKTTLEIANGRCRVVIEPTTKAEVTALGLLEEATRLSQQAIQVRISTDQMGKVTSLNLDGADWS